MTHPGPSSSSSKYAATTTNGSRRDIINMSRGTKTTTTTFSKMQPASQSEIDLAEPHEYKKYLHYDVEVSPDQDDKATEIKLCSLARPHMMAFHCSWWGFFVAFFVWFAISPLLSEIRDDLQLTDEAIWTSSIASVTGTIFMRIVLGPACDKWGARIPMSVVLILCSIPTACTGFVNSSAGLSVLRLFIGCAGGTFVMCQYWTSRMFATDVVGTANALVGGWGNLGGGVTQLIVGAGLFPLMKLAFDGDASKAWRTVSVFPAVLAVFTGILIYKVSDDCPKGNYADLKRHGAMQERSAASFFRQGFFNFNTWILFVQYACCFGTELTMNNAAALYFKDRFDLNTETAAIIASIFGWLNIFARGLGGYCSDKANAQCGMMGRLWVQTGCLVAEGALVLFFAQTQTLLSAIVVMIFFSLFVQAAEGSTYGIVPYVDPPSTGAIAGIVGAGGNLGSVLFSIGFRQLDYKNAFAIMGFSTLAAAFFSVFILIKGHAGMFCGKDEHDHQTTAMGQAQLLTPYTVNSTKRGGTVQYPPRTVRDDDDDDASSDDSDDSCSDDDDDELDLQEEEPPPQQELNTASKGGTNPNNFRMIGTLDDCPIVEEGDEGESDAEE
jgi:NNP family nitrate/nitrite transporter-like MFS transporter